MNEHLDPTGENFSNTEREIERKLRPLSFDDFTGQAPVLENLKIFVEAAKMRDEAMDHVLLHGPPGLGKTTLSHILANELGVGIKITSGPVLDKPSDSSLATGRPGSGTYGRPRPSGWRRKEDNRHHARRKS